MEGITLSDFFRELRETESIIFVGGDDPHCQLNGSYRELLSVVGQWNEGEGADFHLMVYPRDEEHFPVEAMCESEEYLSEGQIRKLIKMFRQFFHQLYVETEFCELILKDQYGIDLSRKRKDMEEGL